MRYIKPVVLLIFIILLTICSTSCDSSMHSDMIYAESFFCDDVLVLPIKCIIWPDGQFDNCKFKCQGLQTLRRTLEKSIEKVDLENKWSIDVDADGHQHLHSSRVTNKTELELIPYSSNRTVVIRKYIDGNLYASYLIVEYEETAIISGSVGKFKDEIGGNNKTYSLLFPVHFLSNPAMFETTATIRDHANHFGEFFDCIVTPAAIESFYRETGRFIIESTKDGFIIQGYNEKYPSYDPLLWPLLEGGFQFHFQANGNTCSVSVELLST